MYRPAENCWNCRYEGLSKCMAQGEFFEDLPHIDMCILHEPEEKEECPTVDKREVF